VNPWNGAGSVRSAREGHRSANRFTRMSGTERANSLTNSSVMVRFYWRTHPIQDQRCESFYENVGNRTSKLIGEFQKRHEGVKNMDLITRKEAQTNGYVRYFTGRKCVYGHISERQTSNGRCMACHKLDERDRYRKLVKQNC